MFCFLNFHSESNNSFGKSFVLNFMHSQIEKLNFSVFLQFFFAFLKFKIQIICHFDLFVGNVANQIRELFYLLLVFTK
jgi:hypothetical protein